MTLSEVLPVVAVTTPLFCAAAEGRATGFLGVLLGFAVGGILAFVGLFGARASLRVGVQGGGLSLLLAFLCVFAAGILARLAVHFLLHRAA